jgi:hypothetical protein
MTIWDSMTIDLRNHIRKNNLLSFSCDAVRICCELLADSVRLSDPLILVARESHLC